MSLTDLATHWRTEAATLRQRGAPQQAEALESSADELESALRAAGQETLSLPEAAAESGYSEEHLRRLVRGGALPANRNEGERTHIRLRRADLPRKPRKRSQSRENGTERYTVDKDARDIAQQLGGFSA